MTGNHCNYYSFGVLLMAVILEQGGEDSDGKPQDHTYDR